MTDLPPPENSEASETPASNAEIANGVPPSTEGLKATANGAKKSDDSDSKPKRLAFTEYLHIQDQYKIIKLKDTNPQIVVRVMGPEDSTRTLVVVHGYDCHSGRYLQTFQVFEKAGWRVIIPDLRGHGLSGGSRGAISKFSDYTADLSAVFKQLVKTPPERTALFGHSNGGLVVPLFVIGHVLSKSTIPCCCLGLNAPFWGLKIIPPAWKAVGGNIFSTIMPFLSLPTELKSQELTRDPAGAKANDEDKLVHKKVNSRYFTEFVKAQKWLAEYLKDHGLPLPTHIIGAGADLVVDTEVISKVVKSITALHEKHPEKQHPYLKFNIYPESYHEVIFDLDRDAAIAEFVSFFEKFVPAVPVVTASIPAVESTSTTTTVETDA